MSFNMILIMVGLRLNFLTIHQNGTSPSITLAFLALLLIRTDKHASFDDTVLATS